MPTNDVGLAHQREYVLALDEIRRAIDQLGYVVEASDAQAYAVLALNSKWQDLQFHARTLRGDIRNGRI